MPGRAGAVLARRDPIRPAARADAPRGAASVILPSPPPRAAEVRITPAPLCEGDLGRRGITAGTAAGRRAEGPRPRRSGRGMSVLAATVPGMDDLAELAASVIAFAAAENLAVVPGRARA